MKSESGRIVTLLGTYHVLKADRMLKKAELKVDLIPAPRHISTECGICIRFCRMDEDRVISLLKSASLEITGVYDE